MTNHVTTRAFLGTPARLVRFWRDILTEIALISAAPKSGPVIGRQRNTLVLSRCRHLAALLLPLTMIWSIIDALVLPTGLWGTLALARFAVGGVFFGIATSSTDATDARSTDAILMALYGVPNAFFLFANLLLAHFNLDERSSGLATTYYYAPFVMAAGIGFFPLTLIESGMILAQLLLVAAITGLADTAHASFFSSIAHVWLLFLVGIVGAFSALSQLQFHVKTIEKLARDTLTGLITRSVGAEILGTQIQMAPASAFL